MCGVGVTVGIFQNVRGRAEHLPQLGPGLKSLANSDFFSREECAVVTFVCSAAAYMAAFVVTYNYIDQKELEKIFSSSFLPPDLYGYAIKIYKYST